MRKLLLLVVFAFSLACSKDDDNNNVPNTGNADLTARLVGNWEMTDLYYDASVPNPLNPFSPINLSGPAENVYGDFNISASPNNVDYNYGFDIESPLDPTQSFPITQVGQGTWNVTSNGTKVVVEQSNNTTTTYTVQENEINRQVWTAKVPTTVPGFNITVNADIRITLIRK
jgi:hypothetical protein